MSDPIVHYAQIERHQKVGDIIRKYSSNKENIYDLAIRMLGLSGPVTVLDIGCGYGNFTESFAKLADRDSVCHGLDCRINFNESFHSILQKYHLKGNFLDWTADYITQIATNTYDVVLSAYSLYYFPELLSQINRILKPTGVLLAITHSKRGMHEFYDDLREVKQQMGLVSNQYFELEGQVEKFCSETGINLLSHHFNETKIITYENLLKFHVEDIEDLIYYLEFRVDMMSEDSELITYKGHKEFKQHFFKYVASRFGSMDSYKLTKTDAILYATHPKKE